MLFEFSEKDYLNILMANGELIAFHPSKKVSQVIALPISNDFKDKNLIKEAKVKI